jgi:hypothetical protein|tara:strand:- start:5094 stop:5276 length:183 start_codon:yes stop_codon:yes gene_type:complete
VKKIKEKKLQERSERVKIKLRKKREALREDKQVKRELGKLQYENRERLDPIVNDEESEEN